MTAKELKFGDDARLSMARGCTGCLAECRVHRGTDDHYGGHGCRGAVERNTYAAGYGRDGWILISTSKGNDYVG